MRCIIAGMVCGLLLLSSFGFSTAHAQSGPANELIQLVNEFRIANGMPALEVNNALMAAAQGHADWQAANHNHFHQGAGGSMPQDRANAAGYSGLVGENVANGTRGYVSSAWAVDGWAGSYGHRITMLSRNVHIGAGVAENADETYYVLMVGSPSSSSPGSRPNPTQSSEEATVPPVIVVPIIVATPREDGAIVHVVQQGQTAWAIASRYGIALEELLAINHLSRNAMLHPGDEIIIRLGEGQAPPPLPTIPTSHIVQDGESLWGIAVKYGLTLDELLVLNGLTRGAIIKPRDKLQLHIFEPSPTTPATIEPISTPTEMTPTSRASQTPIPTAVAVMLDSTLVLSVAPIPTSRPSPQTEVEEEHTYQTEIAIAITLAVFGAVFLFGGILMMSRRRGLQ